MSKNPPLTLMCFDGRRLSLPSARSEKAADSDSYLSFRVISHLGDVWSQNVWTMSGLSVSRLCVITSLSAKSSRERERESEEAWLVEWHLVSESKPLFAKRDNARRYAGWKSDTLIYPHPNQPRVG